MADRRPSGAAPQAPCGGPAHQLLNRLAARPIWLSTVLRFVTIVTMEAWQPPASRHALYQVDK
jgi:hypothetical protein